MPECFGIFGRFPKAAQNPTDSLVIFDAAQASGIRVLCQVPAGIHVADKRNHGIIAAADQRFCGSLLFGIRTVNSEERFGIRQRCNRIIDICSIFCAVKPVARGDGVFRLLFGFLACHLREGRAAIEESVALMQRIRCIRCADAILNGHLYRRCPSLRALERWGVSLVATSDQRAPPFGILRAFEKARPKLLF